MPNWWFNDNAQGRPAALRKICQSSSRAADPTRTLANPILVIEAGLVTAQKVESAFGERFVIFIPDGTKAVERL
jgi:hypothetical protein